MIGIGMFLYFHLKYFASYKVIALDIFESVKSE